LLASMAYQESQFDPKARSWAGAIGLMQIMPATADYLGIGNPSVPENNIRAAVKYLDELQDKFSTVTDSTEKLKFVLASYNVGPNHVEDARRLAVKYGDDENTWNNHVEQWILKKSQKEYYTDEVVKYGYCRGTEPFKYVTEIMDRYNQYKLFIQEN
ncbi:MAG: transglycosylase SLT domain-containing protein, partial [Bacteroidales bacterium]|nr:transglycosylase SLT domain-containing protein [Bacteroidales bacterium]